MSNYHDKYLKYKKKYINLKYSYEKNNDQYNLNDEQKGGMLKKLFGWTTKPEIKAKSDTKVETDKKDKFMVFFYDSTNQRVNNVFKLLTKPMDMTIFNTQLNYMFGIFSYTIDESSFKPFLHYNFDIEFNDDILKTAFEKAITEYKSTNIAGTEITTPFKVVFHDHNYKEIVALLFKIKEFINTNLDNLYSPLIINILRLLQVIQYGYLINANEDLIGDFKGNAIILPVGLTSKEELKICPSDIFYTTSIPNLIQSNKSTPENKLKSSSSTPTNNKQVLKQDIKNVLTKYINTNTLNTFMDPDDNKKALCEFPNDIKSGAITSMVLVKQYNEDGETKIKLVDDFSYCAPIITTVDSVDNKRRATF